MTQKVKEVYCFKNIIKTPDGTKLDATHTAVASHTDSITGELYINSGIDELVKGLRSTT